MVAAAEQIFSNQHGFSLGVRRWDSGASLEHWARLFEVGEARMDS